MGMSAGQARLLSIMRRLTNNEFRAQTITNSKLRLADKSTEASQEYMDALNSKQLMFMNYSDSGTATKTDLTPALIYQFASMKNQYAVVNSSGQILVSSKDADNYKKSDTLAEFLACYGLVDSSELEKYNSQMAAYNTAKQDYDAQMEAYNKELEAYNKDLEAYNKELADRQADYDKKMADYNEKMEQYNKDYQEWLNWQGAVDLYSLFSSAVGTSATADGNGGSYCYFHALEGNATCYLHLLNELLDFDGQRIDAKTYEASNNKNVTTKTSIGTGGMWGTTTADGTSVQEIMKQVSEGLNEKSNGSYIRVCDGKDVGTNGDKNLLQLAKEAGRTPTELEILKSDYVENADGTYSLKSLKQKTIDMYYIIANNLVTDEDEMHDLLVNFTDGDLQKLTLPEPDKPDLPDRPTMPPFDKKPPELPNRPQMPELPKFSLYVKDKEKSQWYTNLWYRMDGQSTSEKIKEKDYSNVGVEDLEENDIDSKLYVLNNRAKSMSGQTYALFEDNLFANSDWLQFALEHGMVTLEVVSFSDSKATEYPITQKLDWKSIIYTNATDIVSEEDEVAIALAEVKYKNKTTEIQNEDKKFDQELKKLDTEHSALQTEYESVKEVISKNVDRSFKAFS